MSNPNKKALTIAAIIVAILGLYMIDAVFPTWSWECRALRSDFGAGINHIPEVANDPQTGSQQRHLWLTLPKGCTAIPDNLLRRFAEWIAS